MTERERLLELLKIPYEVCKNTSCKICEHNTKYYCFLERYTDSLLANGVIVPPVNVGDTVFIIDEYRNEEKQVCETKVFCIEKYADRLTTQLFPGRMAICVDDPWDSHAFVRRNTGEVYLTKEEAEAALKERDGE